MSKTLTRLSIASVSSAAILMALVVLPSTQLRANDFGGLFDFLGFDGGGSNSGPKNSGGVTFDSSKPAGQQEAITYEGEGQSHGEEIHCETIYEEYSDSMYENMEYDYEIHEDCMPDVDMDEIHGDPVPEPTTLALLSLGGGLGLLARRRRRQKASA